MAPGSPAQPGSGACVWLRDTCPPRAWVREWSRDPRASCKELEAWFHSFYKFELQKQSNPFLLLAIFTIYKLMHVISSCNLCTYSTTWEVHRAGYDHFCSSGNRLYVEVLFT